MENHEERLIRLEELTFFQEERLEALNAALTAQQRQLDAVEQQLAEAVDMLRALRLRIAEKRGLPAYMIFNDATLRNMCAMKPQTPEQLLAVPGVGEAKLRNYGGEFLRAIARWKKE